VIHVVFNREAAKNGPRIEAYTYTILCEEGKHQVRIDRNKGIQLSHHDINEEETLEAMGLPTSQCFNLAKTTYDDLEQLHDIAIRSDNPELLDFVVAVRKTLLENSERE